MAAAVAITTAGQVLPCNTTGLTHISGTHGKHTSKMKINTQAHKCYFTHLLCSIYSKHSHKMFRSNLKCPVSGPNMDEASEVAMETQIPTESY